MTKPDDEPLRPSWTERLANLSAPQAGGLVIGLGVLCTLPSVFTGIAADDWFQVGLFTGSNPLASDRSLLLSLFEFLPREDTSGTLRDLTLSPWWGAADASVSFLRPLSALTHWADYTAAPGQWVLWHLHSLAWYAVLLALARRWYRTWLGTTGGAALLAALLFAVEDHHALATGWLANRNALVSAVFAMAGLLFHQHGRTAGRLSSQALGLGLFVAGLLGGESGVGALAYLVAWELLLAPGSRLRRAASVSSWLLALAGWRVAYNTLGFGAQNIGLYVDPGREPLAFLATLAVHPPWLLLGQWTPVPPDLFLVLPRTLRLSGAAAGGILILGLLAWAGPVLRRDRTALALALGSGLALIPVSATLPMDRLLLWSGLGATGLLARVALDPSTGWRHTTSRGLLFLHGPVAAALLAVRCAAMPVAFASIFSVVARVAPQDAEFSRQTLFALNGNEIPLLYLHTVRRELGGPVPARTALLSGIGDATYTATDAHTLDLVVEGGLFARPVEAVFLATSRTFTPGEVLRTPNFEVRIQAVTPDGRPEALSFRFPERLDSDRYRWMALGEHGVAEVPAFAVGETRVLRANLFAPPAPPLPGEVPRWMARLWD